MPHLRTCLPIAAGATALGAFVLAAWRTLRHQGRNEAFGLSDALSAGAIGGLVGMAVGAALCVLRDGTAHPGGGAVGGWLGRVLPFAGPALIVGAALGAATAFTLTWAVARRRGRAGDGPTA